MNSPGRSTLLRDVWLLAALLGAATTQAQVVPYDIGGALRSSEQAQQAAPKPPPAAPLVLPQPLAPQFTIASGETLLVRRFIVVGGEGLLPDETGLRAMLSPYEGRQLTLAEIYEAADKVTGLFREHGYLIAKAYVPVQDARGDALTLKVLPGRYGEVALNNQSLVGNGRLRGALDGHQIRSGQLIERESLERAMLLISDLHGATMPRAVVGAGTAQGTSDFQFEVPEQRRIDGFALVDNFGTDYTGLRRASAGLDANSLLGLGDQLSAFGMISTGEGLRNGRVAYSLPVGYHGLRAEAAVFRTTYALGGTYRRLDSTGVADGASATLSYPIRRSRDDSLWITTSYLRKNLDDRSGDVSYARRDINEGTLGVNRDLDFPLLGLPFAASTALAITYGEVHFPEPDQRAANQHGANTVGTFSKLTASLNATLAVAEKWSLSVNVHAQYSLTGNLDSSEQFSLTGSYGVRSFFEGLAGDRGWLVTPEMRYALPGLQGWRHSVGAFADGGGVTLANGNYTALQPTYLQLNDFGLGYYGGHEYSPGRQLQLKAYLAQTAGGGGGVSGYNRGRVALVQLGFTF